MTDGEGLGDGVADPEADGAGVAEAPPLAEAAAEPEAPAVALDAGVGVAAADALALAPGLPLGASVMTGVGVGGGVASPIGFVLMSKTPLLSTVTVESASFWSARMALMPSTVAPGLAKWICHSVPPV